MIIAIILAAGESQRMGSPKALLKINGKTFVRHIIDVYSTTNVEKIVIVIGAHAQEIKKELLGLNVTVAVNKNYNTGQLSSIITGIEVTKAFHPDGVLIHPVDHPLISAGVINSLVVKFNESPNLIVLPSFKGKRGHPVLFSTKLFDELKNAPLEIGARSVVWSHSNEVIEVETEEKGIILDIDTPGDYERTNL